MQSFSRADNWKVDIDNTPQFNGLSPFGEVRKLLLLLFLQITYAFLSFLDFFIFFLFGFLSVLFSSFSSPPFFLIWGQIFRH